MSIAIDKGDHVLAMGVVEDFIYLNCSSSTHYIQVINLFSQKNAINDRF